MAGGNYRHNFDGFLIYGQSAQTASARRYWQIFRNGSIEAVEAFLLRFRGDKRLIPSVAYEQWLLKALPRSLSIQKQLGVEPPLLVMLSLLGVSGYAMAVDPSRLFLHEAHPIDRDNLLASDILVENFECDPAEVMRPVFDAIWNAAGWPRSMNYDETGQWVGR